MAEYKRESVLKGDKARWPWMTGEGGYKQPTKEGYDFVGWKYNGTVYAPPYTESENPFGPINSTTEIFASWKKQGSSSYEVYIPEEERSISAVAGDDITISANFKQGSVPYSAPYSAIFKHTISDDIWTRIYIQENNDKISYKFKAEYGVDKFMVVMNKSEINSIYDSLDRTKIEATISQPYSIKITSPESGSITYEVNDEVTISAEFYNNDSPYEAPYSAIFVRTGETYEKIKNYQNKNSISEDYIITSNAVNAFYVAISKTEINNINDASVKKEISAREKGSSKAIDFDVLLKPFNDIITSNNKYKEINKESTKDVYDYLKEGYDMAIGEYERNTKGLFADTIFKDEEAMDYHGTGDDYDSTYEVDGTAENAMLAWLMAMQLSELVPDCSTDKEPDNNTQTELFKEAYNIVVKKDDDGNIVIPPLYSLNENKKGFTLKGDPTVARLVAGAIYVLTREGKNISALRDKLNGSDICGGIWEGICYEPSTGGADSPMVKLGYLVNTNKFFPKAPGPFLTGYDNSLPKGQNANLFYDDDRERYWEKRNYKKDVEIDNYVTRNYVMYNGDGHVLYDKTQTLSPENKANITRMLEAAAIPSSMDYVFLGSKNVKYDKTDVYTFVDKDSSYTIAKHRFKATTEEYTDTNDVFKIEGPFSALQSKMFSGTTTAKGKDNVNYDLPNRTNEMKRISFLMSIADNSRWPTMQGTSGEGSGRMRPLGNDPDGSARATNQYDVEGGLQNGTLMALCGDNFSISPCAGSMANLYTLTDDEAWDDFPHDKAKSYPSGHSAQAWFLAMYLSQGNKDNLTTFMKNGIRFSANRSVGRYHWNSDVMYGRLFGTIILPIINAMDDKGIFVKVENKTGRTIGFKQIKMYCIDDSSNYTLVHHDDGTSTYEYIPHCGDLDSGEICPICLQADEISESIYLNYPCGHFLKKGKTYFSPINGAHRAILLYDKGEIRFSDHLIVEPFGTFNEDNPSDKSGFEEIKFGQEYTLKVVRVDGEVTYDCD